MYTSCNKVVLVKRVKEVGNLARLDMYMMWDGDEMACGTTDRDSCIRRRISTINRGRRAICRALGPTLVRGAKQSRRRYPPSISPQMEMGKRLCRHSEICNRSETERRPLCTLPRPFSTNQTFELRLERFLYFHK